MEYTWGVFRDNACLAINVATRGTSKERLYGEFNFEDLNPINIVAGIENFVIFTKL